jgi:cell division septation protein DedD
MMVLLIALLGLCEAARAQFSDDDVRQRLDYIYTGQAERVRNELPTLQKQYPNSSGVEYLDALLTTDGSVAVKKFQSMADRYAESEWADDALYKIYQYYYSLGLYKTADLTMSQLRKRYPSSVFVTGSSVAPKTGRKAETAQAPLVPKNEDNEEAVPNDNEQSQERIDTPPALGKFAVQVGAFSTRENALKQINFLATLGKTGTITSKSIGGKTLFIVLIEGFATENQARDFIVDLKTNHNIDAIIVLR